MLLLNDDAALEPGSLGILVSEMQPAAPDVVGLAPKVLLDLPEPVIDNVGAAITPDGSVHNRGYNQKDIGQFDEQVDVAGACFAATLLRREAFELLMSAPRHSLFHVRRGLRLVSSGPSARLPVCGLPQAVVGHAHSLSSATFPSTFKWQLIRRNSMLTVVKGFPGRLATKLVYGYMHDSLRRAVRGTDRRQAITGMASFARLVPWAVWQRTTIRGLFRDNPVDATLFNPHVAAQPNSPQGTS